MHVIRTSLLLLSLCIAQILHAQTIVSRVTFPIDKAQTINDLAKAGLDLTHGHGKLGTHFTTEALDFELERFDQLGLRYTIDIADLSKHRKESLSHTRNGLLECQDDLNNAIVPKNFNLGSVGGFFSLPEVLDQLDEMSYLYPDLISIRRPIGNIKTWHNNEIFWVRISDNPEVDEDEPEVLYTGLMHAREFVTVSQQLFYMWYLLENYSKDPLIKQMLDHTELYFIPVINPDGFNYNVQGYDADEDAFNRFHRKNCRDNDGDGIFDPKNDGVDLNRNFGSHWGHDNIGSSGYEGASNYRGPSPFSEPETQAIRLFCQNRNIKFALNYHSYGNLLIYPYGFSNGHTKDSVAFVHYAQLLTALNRFVYGLGSETVGYVTNGDSDDWMYDEHEVFAMTPEVGDGDDDFYPAKERIIPLCKSTLQMNILAARSVNSLIVITDDSPAFIHAGSNDLQLEFNRFGLLDGEVQISFKAITPNITQVPSPIVFDLDKFEAHERLLSFHVNDNIQYGSTVRMEIICRQGEYTFRDTITKVRADYNVLIEDTGDLTQWDRSEGTTWGLSKATFKSGPSAITDSPAGLYGPNKREIISLKETIDLTGVTEAYAQFWTRWDIEDEYDFVVFQASTDGENWDNLCGERSKLGGVFQLYEQPLYDGKQTQWVLETSDLSHYLGEHIQLRFMLGTDGFVFKDGFYFDDFRVITINEETVSSKEISESAISVFPNPAKNNFKIKLPQTANTSVVVYNSLGHQIYTKKSIESSFHDVNTAGWANGIYKYILYSDGVPVHHGNISVIH